MTGLPSGLTEAFEYLERLRFDQFMELALYAPASGFFATHGRAGRRGGDFITSPEVGPLFGTVVARRLDALWESLGRPEPFTVSEVGAGRGALAISVLAAGPACAEALHWVLVERSATLRAAASEHLEILDTPPGSGKGPWVTSAGDLAPRGPDSDPAGSPVVGAVVANELLDNLPFRLMERAGDTWSEVFVTPRADTTPDAPGSGLAEVLVGVAPDVGAVLDGLAPEAAEGARVPFQEQAGHWVAAARGHLSAGLVLVFDYCDRTPSLAGRPQSEWLRTYRSHQRGADALESAGTQDITVEVAIDQLPPPSVVTTQAEWLHDHGLDDLVSDARERWLQHAAVGNLAAVRARSAIVEAEALCDPSGLGGFTAMEWHVT